MKLFFAALICVLFTMACVPARMVTGIYKSNYGDSLKIFDDHTFRAELREPDTVTLKQVKYSGGRWNLEKGKLYLSTATRDMGPYWGCVPMKVSVNHLSRPVECTENKSGSLSFNKILIKNKHRSRRPKKEKN